MRQQPVSTHGRLFCVSAAARYLGVSRYRVFALIARGAIVAVRDAGGKLEGVYQRDCDAWVAAHRRAAMTPAARTAAVDGLVATLPGGAGHFA